jgi:superfamily II DNA or RNA helicase
MITVTVDVKNKRLKLDFETDIELQQMTASLTKKIRNWRFRARGGWNGDVRFLRRNHTAHIGLWYEIKKICEKFKLEYQYRNLATILDDVKEEEVKEFCMDLMKDHPKITPYDYQIRAVMMLYNHLYSMADLSTSAGKTLIMYMYWSFLKHKRGYKNGLIICPDTDLVVQGYSDFMDYCGDGKYAPKPNMCMVHGGSSLKNIDEYELTIGNFQTLSNRGESFFNNIDAILVDEGHRAKSKSIREIWERCKNSKSCVGLSGTLKKDNSADYLELVSIMGPKVIRVKKKDLIDAGRATPIEIRIIVLKYATREECRKIAMRNENENVQGSEVFNLEQELVRSSKVRLEFVTKLAMASNDNTLVYYIDVKNKYGLRICDNIKQRSGNKSVYYIDGNTKKETRSKYMQVLEATDNNVLVASWTTFSTGKSVKNLHRIITAENMVSETIVGQGLGRGMRLHGSKDKFIWYDIVDDFSYKDDVTEIDYVGKLKKQMGERIKIYKEEGLPYTIKHINLIPDSHSNQLF